MMCEDRRRHFAAAPCRNKHDDCGSGHKAGHPAASSVEKCPGRGAWTGGGGRSGVSGTGTGGARHQRKQARTDVSNPPTTNEEVAAGAHISSPADSVLGLTGHRPPRPRTQPDPNWQSEHIHIPGRAEQTPTPPTHPTPAVTRPQVTPGANQAEMRTAMAQTIARTRPPTPPHQSPHQ